MTGREPNGTPDVVRGQRGESPRPPPRTLPDEVRPSSRMAVFLYKCLHSIVGESPKVFMTETELATQAPSDIWTDLDRAFDELTSQFYPGFGLTFAPIGRSLPSGLRAPRVDVTDSGAAFTIVAEIPGIPKEKLEIRVKGSSVELKGETTTETSEKKPEFLHQERTYQGFYRQFELPETVVADKAEAKVENGLLTLVLPKQTPTPSPEEVVVKVA